VAGRAAALTGVGSAVVERLGVETARPVRLLPMGVDLSSLFTPDSGNSRQPMRVLYVGRLIASKRPAAVVAAIDLLRRQGLDVSLEIIGAGPEDARLQRQACGLGLSDVVDFIGRVPQQQLASHYRRAAVTVLASGDASAPEGLGLVAIEALGCGCPVVSSPNAALAAALPAEAPVVFVPSANPEDLARGIRTCVESLAGDACTRPGWRQELVSRFDWPHAAEGYSILFNQLIQGLRSATK
jgi:glycosyltransferase involved in cell wall biosynthesis